MINVAEHAIPGPVRIHPHVHHRAVRSAGLRLRCRDSRWPELAAALAALRAGKRHSVRIVDADCGSGALLLCAVRHARALGFTAIEARGIGHAPAMVERARAAAAGVRDPAIDVCFEMGDLASALDGESDFPADIVVWHGRNGRDAQAIAAAGRMLISEPASANGASKMTPCAPR